MGSFSPATCASEKILYGLQMCERKQVRCGEPQPLQTRAEAKRVSSEDASQMIFVPRSSAARTVRPASMECVSHTLPPITQLSPMCVMPPRIVAPA